MSWALMGFYCKFVALIKAQGKITCPVCVLSTFNYNTVVVFPLQGPSFPHAVMLSVPQNKATSNMTSGGTHFLPGLFDLAL